MWRNNCHFFAKIMAELIKGGKRLNADGYLGKINHNMIDSALAAADEEFRKIIETDEQSAKIILTSLRKVTSSINANGKKGKGNYKKKDHELEERNKKILEDISKYAGISTSIVELRKFAAKFAKESQIAFTDEMLEKAVLLDWLNENMSKIKEYCQNTN